MLAELDQICDGMIFFTDKEDLEFGYVALRADGIMYVFINPEVRVDVEQVKQITKAIYTVGKGGNFPILIDAGIYSMPDESARKFLASNDSKNNAIAEAYVIKSLSQKIVANFYLNFHKPQRPTKIFEDEKEALKWLKSFL